MLMNPHLQSFFYKSHCLPKLTYILSNAYLDTATRNEINTRQNNLIRMIIGINKRCHISKLLKVIKVYNFDQLYAISKVRLIISIKNNSLTNEILEILVKDKIIRSKKSKSILTDLVYLESYLNKTKASILESPQSVVRTIKEQLSYQDGLTASIKTCVDNFNDPIYRAMLRNLTKSYEYPDERTNNTFSNN